MGAKQYTNPRPSPDVENPANLAGIDRREKELIPDSRGHEDMRQVKALLLELSAVSIRSPMVSASDYRQDGTNLVTRQEIYWWLRVSWTRSGDWGAENTTLTARSVTTAVLDGVFVDAGSH